MDSADAGSNLISADVIFENGLGQESRSGSRHIEGWIHAIRVSQYTTDWDKGEVEGL